MITATVREWHEEEGWGVLDSTETPGGCFAHFSDIEMAGFRTLDPGRQVQLEWEAPVSSRTATTSAPAEWFPDTSAIGGRNTNHQPIATSSSRAATAAGTACWTSPASANWSSARARFILPDVDGPLADIARTARRMSGSDHVRRGSADTPSPTSQKEVALNEVPEEPSRLHGIGR